MNTPAIQPLLFNQTRQETFLCNIPKPLDGVLKMNGRSYNLVERISNVAIYEGPVSNDRPEVRMYEVVIVRTAKESVFPNGSTMPFREVYPSSEQWGTYGWTFTANSHRDPLQAARTKMIALLKRPAKLAA